MKYPNNTFFQQDDPLEPCRNGKILHVPLKWTREVFESILYEIPVGMKKAVTDTDTRLQKALIAKVDSIF